MASLTKSQQLVYDYLCSTMAERAVPPSVREICAATGLRSTSTVHSHLKSLDSFLLPCCGLCFRAAENAGR